MRALEASFVSISHVDSLITFRRAQEDFISSLRPACFDGLASNWPALKRPEFHSIENLAAKYDADVPVVSSKADDAYGSESRTQMKASEWAKLKTEDRSYLKDFHLKLAFPLDDSYSVPVIFDDWLNAFNDARTLAGGIADDYRFLYASHAGARTPLHIDVLKSHSWSANVTGWKLWLFFDDEVVKDLYSRGDLTVSDLSGEPVVAAAENLIQRLKDNDSSSALHRSALTSSDDHWTKSDRPSRMYCLQGPGDIVFVPSGLHHQVVNLSSPTISINHNWFGGAALKRVWEFLKSELAAVRHAIADVGLEGIEYEKHCQVLLKAQTGFNLDDFGSLLQMQKRKMASKVPLAGCQLTTEDYNVPICDLPFLDPHESHLIGLPSEMVAESKKQLESVTIDFLNDPYVVLCGDEVDRCPSNSEPEKKQSEVLQVLRDKLGQLFDLYASPRLDSWKRDDFAS